LTIFYTEKTYAIAGQSPSKRYEKKGFLIEKFSNSQKNLKYTDPCEEENFLYVKLIK
jgi:hypothetical protein